MSQNKIALITGASRGIGKAVAEYLVTLDYHVILVARSEDTLKIICDDIKSRNGSASYYTVDVTDVNQIKTCVDNIVQKHGHVDVFFNNAGISLIGTSSAADADIQRVLDLNLSGAIYFAKYIALQMKQQQSGYIINLSSMSGKVTSANLGIYNASKFGLCGFSEALAKEMAEFNVKVTAICPGMVATDMTADFNFEQSLMLSVNDICTTIQYLLNLGPNVLVTEVMLNCAPYLVKLNEAQKQIFQA